MTKRRLGAQAAEQLVEQTSGSQLVVEAGTTLGEHGAHAPIAQSLYGDR